MTKRQQKKNPEKRKHIFFNVSNVAVAALEELPHVVGLSAYFEQTLSVVLPMALLVIIE